MKTNNKGFSLVELIVVIAIMAILAAVAIPTFASFITKANKASDTSYMNDIAYAINLALAKEGGVPDGYEIQITINEDSEFSYAVVLKTATSTTRGLTATEAADIEAMLEDDYTAKGLSKGKYHKVGEDWVTCTCPTTANP